MENRPASVVGSRQFRLVSYGAAAAAALEIHSVVRWRAAFAVEISTEIFCALSDFTDAFLNENCPMCAPIITVIMANGGGQQMKGADSVMWRQSSNENFNGFYALK